MTDPEDYQLPDDPFDPADWLGTKPEHPWLDYTEEDYPRDPS